MPIIPYLLEGVKSADQRIGNYWPWVWACCACIAVIATVLITSSTVQAKVAFGWRALSETKATVPSADVTPLTIVR